MTKVSRLVLAGTPLSVNAGDFGSKQEAVPSQEKSTPKPGDCASAGLAPASATTIQNRFNIAASSRERPPLGCMRDWGVPTHELRPFGNCRPTSALPHERP